MLFFRPTALAGGLTIICLTGCQSAGGFGATMTDVRDTLANAIGLKPATQKTKADVKEAIQTVADHQRGLRNQVQQTHHELDALTRAPEDDLSTQHTAYTHALQNVREQVGVTTQLRGEALSATDIYSAQITSTLMEKVTNPALRDVAQRNLDLFKTGVADAISQTGQYDVDLNPLLAGFDGHAATLKEGATAETVGRVRGQLAQLTTQVQGVLAGLDTQVLELESLIDQVDMIDASTSTLGM